MSYIIDNNVLTTLHTAITTSSTSLIVDVPSSPNKPPVTPVAGNIATLTLVDSLASPTQTEIVTYTAATNNGDGTYTLTGVTRGTEGTAAQNFSTGAPCFQAITAATINSIASIGVNTLLQFCGNGSSGDATVSTAISLTADTFFRNLTITPTGSINTAGFILYVGSVLDLTAAPAGAIHGSPGAAGTSPGAGAIGGVGGAGATSATAPGGASGGAGAGTSNQPGSSGGAANCGIRADGGDGGKANSSGATQGFGGFNNAITLLGRPGSQFTYNNAGVQALFGAGCGGGGGASGSSVGKAGGGGGGGGGMCVVYAATISTSSSTPAGVITGGVGGDGGDGGTSGGGAGGGGGGGGALVAYGSRVGPAITNGIASIGGKSGSTPLSASSYPYGGYSGTISVFNLLSGQSTFTNFSAGVQGSLGAHGAGGVANATL
jgi:hypothetical protein